MIRVRARRSMPRSLVPIRHRYWLTASVVLLAIAATVVVWRRSAGSDPNKAQVRQDLFDELKPVKLSNCELGRFGEPHDGGYLLCRNLLGSVEVGYSYGISGYDGWGCDVSRTLNIEVHQYDCFDLKQPSCPNGATRFHHECVAGSPRHEEGRTFDTVERQIVKNSDHARHLVMKIDVEGAEWDVFSTVPEEVLERIDQIAVEFHRNDDPRFVDVIRRLKRFFYVAHVHFNNYSCTPNQKPFSAWAYEVLFVNKRLGKVDPSGVWSGLHPLDAPNDGRLDDCQATFQ